MEKLAIIVPAHNEERRAGSTVKAYLDFFKKLKGIEAEVIVVLNACTDRTREVVEQYKCKELRILEFKRGGKGFAVIEGFKAAIERKADVIGFVDADMATTPAEYYRLFRRLKGHDGVIADRYLKGAVVYPKPTMARKIARRVYNSLIRVLFLMPYKDTQCGAKMFRREVVEVIVPKIGMTKWAFDVELLYEMMDAGFDVIAVPTMWTDKEYSKIKFFQAGPMMVLGVVRLRILHSPLKHFIRVYDFGAEIIRREIKRWQK